MNLIRSNQISKIIITFTIIFTFTHTNKKLFATSLALDFKQTTFVRINIRYLLWIKDTKSWYGIFIPPSWLLVGKSQNIVIISIHLMTICFIDPNKLFNLYKLNTTNNRADASHLPLIRKCQRSSETFNELLHSVIHCRSSNGRKDTTVFLILSYTTLHSIPLTTTFHIETRRDWRSKKVARLD